MTAYYNEIDPFAAQWLRNLIAAGLIAPGVVDERSITDVRPSELAVFTQCHFFAGIGGWSLALRLAGWPDDEPVWTGSCPCQPFSVAGKGKGAADERHLWPVWFDLIRECRPSTVFGEQVAAAVGHNWLDAVQGDLEGEGYAVGSAVLGAHSVGAPHIRQRLWFVADSNGGNARTEGLQRGGEQRQQQEDGRAGLLADAGRQQRIGRQDAERPVGKDSSERIEGDTDDQCSGGSRGVADAPSKRERADKPGSDRGAEQFVVGSGARSDGCDDGADGGVALPDRAGQQRLADPDRRVEGSGLDGGVADASSGRRQQLKIFAGSDGARGGEREERVKPRDSSVHPDDPLRSGPLHGFWRAADWLFCRDGKWRPTQSALLGVAPGVSLGMVPCSTGDGRFFLSPLVQGAPSRVGRLRGYGNAIVPQAAEFIDAYMEILR